MKAQARSIVSRPEPGPLRTRFFRGPLRAAVAALEPPLLDSAQEAHLVKMGMDDAARVAHTRAELARRGGAMFLAELGGHNAGMLLLRPDPWPSAVLQRRMWTVERLAATSARRAELMASLLRTAEYQLGAFIDCLTGVVPAEDHDLIRSLRACGFQAEGGEVALAARCAPCSGQDLDEIQVGPVLSRDYERVRDLASCCCAVDRYTAERLFGRQRLKDLNERRLLNGFRDKEQLLMTASLPGREPDGFVLISRHAVGAGGAEIRLASVEMMGAGGRQRERICRALLRGTLTQLAQLGCHALVARVVLASESVPWSLPVLRECGFEPGCTGLLMRRWFDR